jgi:hypothetical protein
MIYPDIYVTNNFIFIFFSKCEKYLFLLKAQYKIFPLRANIFLYSFCGACFHETIQNICLHALTPPPTVKESAFLKTVGRDFDWGRGTCEIFGEECSHFFMKYFFDLRPRSKFFACGGKNHRRGTGGMTPQCFEKNKRYVEHVKKIF